MVHNLVFKDGAGELDVEVFSMKKKDILALLGAVIGGLVAAIPWILVYVFGNMIFSALAALIAIGALFGYKLFKGTYFKQLSIIISLISVLIVTLVTLVIIPLIELYRADYVVSFENLSILYTFDSFKSSIIKDYVISLIFTFLGISGVIKNIKDNAEI